MASFETDKLLNTYIEGEGWLGWARETVFLYFLKKHMLTLTDKVSLYGFLKTTHWSHTNNAIKPWGM